MHKIINVKNNSIAMQNMLNISLLRIFLILILSNFVDEK